MAIIDSNGHRLMGDDHAMPIYSIAKTFIASAICQSNIDPHAPVSQWIDSAWAPQNPDITVEQLLNHSSGLRDYTGLPDYTEAVQTSEPSWSDDEYANRTLRQPLLFTPGTGFAYSNSGYWLLKHILERLHGTTAFTFANKV